MVENSSAPVEKALIHLGAGRCKNLPDHLASGATKIILAEANPQLAAELKQRTAGDDRVQVVDAAVGGKSGAAKFKLYNLEEASSLRPPTGLTEIYPGIRLEREVDVDVIGITELLERFSLEGDGAHALVVDTPGEEYEILRALQDNNKLNVFGEIQVRCGRTPLYEKSGGSKSILDLLNDALYETRQIEADDPEFPVFHARLNVTLRKNVILEKQLDALRSKMNETVAALKEEHQEELSTLREEREKEAASLSAQIESLKGDIQEREHRGMLMDGEVVKAEAQIELIKDILIRDKAF